MEPDVRNPLPLRSKELGLSVWGADLKMLCFPSAQAPSCCRQFICQRSMMLYSLIDVYLSNLARRASYLELITMSGFSYVYSSMASYLELFGPNFYLWMAVLTSEINSMACVMLSLWKLKSIEANYSYWCKIGIGVRVRFNLSECFLGNFSLSPGSRHHKHLRGMGLHQAGGRDAPHSPQHEGYFSSDAPHAESESHTDFISPAQVVWWCCWCRVN